MMDKFAQSLAVEEQTKEKNIYFDFIKEDTSCLFKKAYVTSMKNPTGEKIKDAVSARVKADLGVKDANVRVVVKAKDVEGENVTNGEGTASVNINGKTVSIPFNIVDGEISDLTEIKVGKDSIAYNKQSLSKLSKGAKPSNGETNAFVGTTKIDNESTDRGFLDEVIKIRDAHVSKQNSGSGGRYITATEACTDMLQKSASIVEINESDYNAVEHMVREKIANSVQDKIEKIASVDIDKKVSHAEEVFARIDNLPLESVHTMKHGQTILFPEFNGNELSMTAGVVFKNIDKGFYAAGGDYNPVTSDYTTMVASYDGRIALIGSGKPMLALPDDLVKFKLPTTRIKASVGSQNYFAVIGNKIIAPFYVMDRYANAYDAHDIVKELSEMIGVEDPIIPCKPAFVNCNGWISTIDVLLIPGETFAANLKKVKVGGRARYISGAADVLKKMLAHKPALMTSVCSMINLESSVAADPDTKIVKIKGLITGYITNKKELSPNLNRAEDNIKIASEDVLTIEKLAKDKEEYAVKVKGKNNKDFGKKLNKTETKTLMLSMGYGPDEIGEAMASVNRKHHYHKPVPSGTNINRLYDGEVESKTKKTMNKIKKAVFNKEKAKEAAKDFGLNMSSAVIGSMAGENEMIYSALEYISKFAKEAEAASIAFEKKAMEHKSEDLQNVAKVMLSAKNVFSAVRETSNGKEYNMFKEACESIVSNKDALEEIVTGICKLSQDQFLQSDEYIPYEMLKSANEIIGAMYELAKVASNVSNQDIVCTKCGAKTDEPLQNGKCRKCAEEELASINEEQSKGEKKDHKEIDGNVGEKDE